MNNFTRLCMRARARGAKRLVFVVDLLEPGTEKGAIFGSWSVSVAGDPCVSGEEALCALVSELERC